MICNKFEVEAARLNDNERDSICLSPPEVVATVANTLSTYIQESQIVVGALLDVCAGDGRLAIGVTQRLTVSPAVVVRFDTLPLSDDVIKGSALDLDFLSSISSTCVTAASQKSIVAVLNPPFSPTVVMTEICKNTLTNLCVDVACMVLPGKYGNFYSLDKLLPPWWHVRECKVLNAQTFDKPFSRSRTKASEITVVIVLVVRRPQQRPSFTPWAHPVSFEYVSNMCDPWDQAFKVGTIRRPVEVVNRGDDAMANFRNGKWLFVRYKFAKDSHPDVSRLVCNMVASRAQLMSGPKGDRTWQTKFPRIGTAGRFYVPRCALTEWLNRVLTEDLSFFFWPSPPIAALGQAEKVTAIAQCRVGAFIDCQIERILNTNMKSKIVQSLKSVSEISAQFVQPDLSDDVSDEPKVWDYSSLVKAPEPVMTMRPSFVKYWQQVQKKCIIRQANHFARISFLEDADGVSVEKKALLSLIQECDASQLAVGDDAICCRHQEELLLLSQKVVLTCRGKDVLEFVSLALSGRQLLILESMPCSSVKNFCQEIGICENDAKARCKLHEMLLNNSLLLYAWDEVDAISKLFLELHESITNHGVFFGEPSPSVELNMEETKTGRRIRIISPEFCKSLLTVTECSEAAQFFNCSGGKRPRNEK